MEATRKGQFWSVALHSGHFWSSEQFKAGGTEYTEREVKRQRSAGPWGALTRGARPQEALSTRQVESLFVAYLLGNQYPPELLGGSH
jgi:hypothetical protein